MSYPTQIEVSDSDFLKTVETESNDCKTNGGRSKRNSHKIMTRRSWGLLSPSRKKKDSDSVGSKHSVSGFNSIGQQSIASMTVNSGTTIKASNLHIASLSSTLATKHVTELNERRDSSGNKHQQNNTTKSNISNNNNNNRHTRPPTPWKSLKRLVSKGRNNRQLTASITSQSSSDLIDPENQTQRRHAKSHDGAEYFSSTKLALDDSYPVRKRFHSDGIRNVPHQDHFDAVSITDSQHVMDQMIRGRLDGIDVLSMGPARRALLPIDSSSNPTEIGDLAKQDKSSNDNNGTDSISFDPLQFSFANLQKSASPAKTVDEMIWTSTGMDQAEIIFEGFYPGCNDRWGVRIVIPSFSSQSSSKIQIPKDSSKKEGDDCASLPSCYDLTADKNDGDESTSTTTTDIDGSIRLPIADLWHSLWGVVATSPPIPSHMNMQTIATASTLKTNSIRRNEDQRFVEMCNVPVDLDDDAFMIDCPRHVNSIHEAVMVPLQARRFDSAISIFEKLLRGLDGNHKYLHLVASTSHNIGMVQLCQGKYQEALKSFQKAVGIRNECLPADHPDIAVSLQREGMAHFALGSMVEALKSFEMALALSTSMDNTRAKILNNIGVTHCQLRDYALAIKSFASALEIQRPWLEGPVRRELIVYSASTILSNTGMVHLRQGEYELAYNAFEEACLMQTSIFQMDHEIVLNSTDNMARARAMNGNYSEALKIFTSLYKSQKVRFGPESKTCIETQGMIGISHFKLMDYEEAEKCMREVAAWQVHNSGMETSHPLVRSTTDRLEQIKRYLNGKESVWI